MSRIFRNAMKTPDGTVIESFHRHDYVAYQDENGELYVVDGGMSYFGRSTNEVQAEDLSIVEIEGVHEHNRKHFRWGTFGKKGDQPLKRIFLMDMKTSHIETILNSEKSIGSSRELFKEELRYRNDYK